MKITKFVIGILFILFLVWAWNWSGKVTKQVFDEKAKTALMGPQQRELYERHKRVEQELQERVWAKERLYGKE